MRHEPVEISKLAVRRSQSSLPRAGRMTLQSHVQPAANKAAVIDEAFADFQAPATATPALVSGIASQLRALDLQREQLAKLLRSVEASAISG